MSKTTLIQIYHAETVQIYFTASLELQEELINSGFKVPSPTPIPIIYSNFGPWVTERPLITSERVIKPERYGKRLEDLGWQVKLIKGKTGYEIPIEKACLRLELEEETNNLHLVLEVSKYHLEKVSIRGINPDKWTNWAMTYTSLKDLDDAVHRLVGLLPFSKSLCHQPLLIKREQQQGGKEDTYFAILKRDDEFGVPITGFSLCLGCFKNALDYLATEARSYGISSSQVDQLRLRLEYTADVGAFAKIGLSRMEGKRPQFMLKLTSAPVTRTIKGVLKSILRGKARGDLIYCSHQAREQRLTIDAQLFLRIACAMRKLFFSLDNPLGDRTCHNCFTSRVLPSWIKEDSL